MIKTPEKDQDERTRALEKEVSRKDWFNSVIAHLDSIEVVYSDPRIKGYVREAHERTINEYLNYIEDHDLKELARVYWHQIKVEGERERIKGVEKNIKNLELILKKKVVPLESKERLINRAEEEIKSQIPEEIRGIYLEMISWMKEKYAE